MKHRGSYLNYFLMNTFYFLSLALFSVIISVYLMDMGYNAREVSLVVTAQYILSMITQPFIGKLCDQYDKRHVGAILMLSAGGLGIIFMFVKNFFAIMIIYAIVMALINGFNPMIERMSVLSSHKYSGIRIWSTIGYALGSQLSGIVYHYISPQAIYLFFSIGTILCVIGILGTKDRVIEQEQVKVAETQSNKWVHSDFVYYLIITVIFYATTNINSTYLPSFYQSLGLSVDRSTTIISLSTFMELPVIIIGSKLVNNISNKKLLMLDMILITIQFGVYGLVNNLTILTLTTILTKAVATMSFIMINQKVVATIVDSKHQMSALSMVGMMKSLSTVAFQLISGYLIDFFSYNTFYIVLTFIGIIGIVVVELYRVPTGNQVKLFE